MHRQEGAFVSEGSSRPSGSLGKNSRTAKTSSAIFPSSHSYGAMLSGFRADECGGTALEYCFIAFLISIVAISAMTQIGAQTLVNTSSVLIGFSR